MPDCLRVTLNAYTMGFMHTTAEGPKLFKMTRITQKIHPGISGQVALLVTENTPSLSMTGVKPSNPLFGPYQVFLMLEARAYMQQVGRTNPSTAELIVAFDDKNLNKVVGFLLYQLVAGAPGEASINYTAVEKSSRGRGVMSAMVKEMLEHHPTASLSCQPGLIPLYERLGFRVDGHRETHVTMSIGNCSGGAVASFTGDVSTHPMITIARQEALKLFGPERIRNELASHQFTIELGTRRAEGIAAERMTHYAKTKD